MNKYLISLFILEICLILGGSCSPVQVDEGSGKQLRLEWRWWSPFPILTRVVQPFECVSEDPDLDVGTCRSQSLCVSNKGTVSGDCSTGGVCCVFPKTCGSTASLNRTWFVNDGFPALSKSLDSCLVKIKKTSKKINQLKLDFRSLDLGKDRFCDNNLVVSVGGKKKHTFCNHNSDQHIYVDVKDQEDINVKVQVSPKSRQFGNGVSWNVLVTQLEKETSAPPGCLQYYEKDSGSLRSLDYLSTDPNQDLNYDICFQDRSLTNKPKTCERQFTEINVNQKHKRSSRTLVQPFSRKVNRDDLIKKFNMNSFSNTRLNDIEQVIKSVSNTLKQVQSTVPKEIPTYVKDNSPFKKMNRNAYFPRDVTTVDVESIDHRPEMEPVTDTSNERRTEDTEEALPILYSVGNDGVINQINNVVQQLQNKVTSNDAQKNQDQLGNGLNVLVTPDDIQNLLVKRSTQAAGETSTNTPLFGNEYEESTEYDQITTSDFEVTEKDNSNKLNIDDLQAIMMELTKNNPTTEGPNLADDTATTEIFEAAITTNENKINISRRPPIDHDILKQILNELNFRTTFAPTAAPTTEEPTSVETEMSYTDTSTTLPIIKSTARPTIVMSVNEKDQFTTEIISNPKTSDKAPSQDKPIVNSDQSQILIESTTKEESPIMVETTTKDEAGHLAESTLFEEVDVYTTNRDDTTPSIINSGDTNNNNYDTIDGIQWLLLDDIEDTLAVTLPPMQEIPDEVMVSTGLGFIEPTTQKYLLNTENSLQGSVNNALNVDQIEINSTPSPNEEKPEDVTLSQNINEITNIKLNSPEEDQSPNEDSSELDDGIRNTNVLPDQDSAENTLEEECDRNYLRIKEYKICGTKFRAASEDHKKDIFRNVDRISLFESRTSKTNLEFEMNYSIVCDREEDGDESDAGTKRVTLLQYLLGWYR